MVIRKKVSGGQRKAYIENWKVLCWEIFGSV